ncbi:Alpha/Beta hydrolase protein [Suillus ampliporus]|nr:Alpha/Beta hydrolase protein [Suillus ampliporus]
MVSFPLIGRLKGHEYAALVGSFFFLVIENALRFIIMLLPVPIIQWFYDRSRTLFHRFSMNRVKGKSKAEDAADAIRKAKDFGELCRYWGYTHEEHVVLTKDGYLLGLHRLPTKRGQRKRSPGTSTGKPVVYLHHGLLMNSEVWVCLTNAERCLPFVLAEQGFDVWMGNNRGNKYSKKSVHHDPNSSKFWNYSLDDFAWHDIPDSIQYILDITKSSSLSYVGFSQGTAQAFAALSIHPQLNEKVNVFIALAPAMSPAGLAAPLVDGLMKASPTLMYLFFGRKAILSSTTTWQAILYPPIFTSAIDTAMHFLFNWDSKNITYLQKIAAYAHLYSFASVKSVVHWFRSCARVHSRCMTTMSARLALLVGVRTDLRGFPTKNIVTSIVLLYGDRDSLVDIKTMLKELPDHTTVKRLAGYEHLDILWGKDVDKDVIPEVVNALRLHCDSCESLDNFKDGYKAFER